MWSVEIIRAKPRSQTEWVLALGKRRMTEMGSEGQNFEAMLHWQDPVERLRTMRRRQRRHTLVDDNPSSG
jgi:hypothetical protein